MQPQRFHVTVVQGTPKVYKLKLLLKKAHQYQLKQTTSTL